MTEAATVASGRGLRNWAGSLSPAWQAVVPGAFAWGVTIVRPAGASLSYVPFGFAVFGFVSLMAGPFLERALPRSQGRLVSFWGFLLGSLAALGTAGVPGPLDAPEAIVGVLSWVLFAVTVAAPALGPTSRGLNGRPDPSLAPRRSVTRRVWPYFAIAIGSSLASFACALAEPNRERATAFTLLAALSSLLVFAALGNQVRFGKNKQKLRVPVLSFLLIFVALGVAGFVGVRTVRARMQPAAPPAHASGILSAWRFPLASCSHCSRSAQPRSRSVSSAFAGTPMRQAASSCSRAS